MSNTNLSERLHTSLLLKFAEKQAPWGPVLLKEIFSSIAFKKLSISCFALFRYQHFRHLKTQSTIDSWRYSEHNWRKPKVRKKQQQQKTQVPQQMCSKDAGHGPMILSLHYSGWAYLCLCHLSFLSKLQYDGWFCFLSS